MYFISSTFSCSSCFFFRCLYLQKFVKVVYAILFVIPLLRSRLIYLFVLDRCSHSLTLPLLIYTLLCLFMFLSICPHFSLFLSFICLAIRHAIVFNLFPFPYFLSFAEWMSVSLSTPDCHVDCITYTQRLSIRSNSCRPTYWAPQIVVATSFCRWFNLFFNQTKILPTRGLSPGLSICGAVSIFYCCLNHENKMCS